MGVGSGCDKGEARLAYAEVGLLDGAGSVPGEEGKVEADSLDHQVPSGMVCGHVANHYHGGRCEAIPKTLSVEKGEDRPRQLSCFPLEASPEASGDNMVLQSQGEGRGAGALSKGVVHVDDKAFFHPFSKNLCHSVSACRRLSCHPLQVHLTLTCTYPLSLSGQLWKDV